ncbi:hypothetical protein NHX12_004833 [Muraenolepis orangiensis]|uniref:C2H2-type domain-containing protein n=1 Tax=Muraenolepis orangiensis TaxID=630683 RepID=A0A9Q0DV85_9TELE|nr:hypothetical protein NHX12_004833 [Muraenolepis orangiensis]
MTQESLSYMDSFDKPCLAKQNGVLDGLSNADMLSPVGLGNGPSSHRATYAHDLNSLSIEKEEEKSITPLKTVQEIDTAGIWGFDVDSPEDSLDDFSSAGDLQWDPHKEFMQFLWDDHDESPGEEMQKEVTASSTQKRRKRKMDMVVMVDPSEDLYPNPGHNSSEDLHNGEAPSIPTSKFKETLANNLFDDDQEAKQEKTHIYTYSRRMSMRGVLQASKRLFDKITTDGNDDEDSPDIKEECVETEVFRDSFESHSTMEGSYTDDLSDLDSKSCPYCPEVFESAVELSNHVRSHLHRVGLDYKERHAVLAEQKTSGDKKPCRMSPIPKLEKVEQLEPPEDPLENSDDPDFIHSCPLCGDTFDNRTGQSNHIRGHLKQLEKGEFNRKVCMHCNATFHSGVSLSNHLRAYAKRKRNALLDGASIDCKGRRPRSRPGSKKKILPLPQTPEEMYRLTCRFCDLVFQGPLSVQEDWIKHLQRHIMNTGVPHTGLSMVEVSMQPQEPSRPDQDGPFTGPFTGPHHAAS